MEKVIYKVVFYRDYLIIGAVHSLTARVSLSFVVVRAERVALISPECSLPRLDSLPLHLVDSIHQLAVPPKVLLNFTSILPGFGCSLSCLYYYVPSCYVEPLFAA